MKEELNYLKIDQTTFYVDLKQNALVEEENRDNKILFNKMRDHGSYFSFDYSRIDKNIHSISGISDMKGILQRILESTQENDSPLNVKIPKSSIYLHAAQRDQSNIVPEKISQSNTLIMSKRQKKIDKGKEALALRLAGHLPTVDILGHTFFVDVRMGKLRPKDDFLSNGISFSDIENYYSEEQKRYIIPYDPKKKEFVPLDYETITEIPKDLKVISFKEEYTLDPVGWNRVHGFSMDKDTIKLHHKATPATWEDIYVPQKIKENLQNISKDNIKETQIEEITKKKGRKI